MSRQGVKSKKLALLAEIKKRKDVLFSNALDVKTKSAKEQCWTEILDKAQILQLAGPGRKWTYARDTLFGGWKTSALVKRTNNRKDVDEVDRAIWDIIDNASDNKIKDEISVSDNYPYDQYSESVIHYEESPSKTEKVFIKPKARRSLLQSNLSVPPKKRGRPSLPVHVESAMETDDSHDEHDDMAVQSTPHVSQFTTIWQRNPDPMESIHKQSKHDHNDVVDDDDEKDLKKQLLRIEIYHRKLHCLKLERQLNLPPSNFTENILNDSLISLSHSFSGSKKRKL